MNNPSIEARELIAKARESLRRGDKASARQLGEQAAFLAPGWEDVWLILAASDSNPQDALAYARKASKINPQSERARRAIEWTASRLKQVQEKVSASPPPIQAAAVTGLPKKHAYQTAVAMPVLRRQGTNWLLPALFIGMAIVFTGFLAIFVVTGPIVASIVNSFSAPAATQENLWAPVDIAKPEVTPIGAGAFAVQLQDTAVPTSVPTFRATATQSPKRSPTDSPPPTDAPTEAPTLIPAATETPGVLAMEVLNDTPTSEYTTPDPEIVVGNGERWIDVDLTNQMTYAYEGDVLVNSFVVSTGTWRTPTVTGKFKIYIRLRSGNMRGPGYFLPDVPYIMYFHKSYGLHGTYWHSNFGTPMSHGCVNLSIPDAAWLYNWSHLGTVVNVHY